MKPSPRRSFIPLHRSTFPEKLLGVVLMFEICIICAELFAH